MILQLNELVNKGKNSLSDHEFQFCIQKKFCHHTPCVSFNLAPKQWLRAAGCLARPECSRVLRGPPGEGQHADLTHTALFNPHNNPMFYILASPLPPFLPFYFEFISDIPKKQKITRNSYIPPPRFPKC